MFSTKAFLVSKSFAVRTNLKKYHEKGAGDRAFFCGKGGVLGFFGLFLLTVMSGGVAD